MIASFFFSLLAGLLVVHVEPPLKTLLTKIDRYEMKLDALEMRLLSFGLLLMVSAIATWAVGANSSAFLTVAGGVLGCFGPQLYAFLRDPDGARGEGEDDWDGGVRETRRRYGVAPLSGDGGADDETEETLRAVQAAVEDESRAEREPDGATETGSEEETPK